MIITTGGSDYQVFQRDQHNQALVTCSGQTTETGTVRVRILRHGVVLEPFAWIKCGCAENGVWSARIPNIPTGGPYKFEFVIGDPEQSNTRTQVQYVLVGDIWLLAGQSNMEGVGPLVGVEEPSAYVSVFGFHEQWEQAVEPLHWRDESPLPAFNPQPSELSKRVKQGRDPHRLTGAGLGISFAKKMHQLTGVPVGLVPSAYGGTSMRQWAPDLVAEGREQCLYGATLIRAEQAGGKITGILWYQGESDANEEHGRLYQERMRHLVQRFRNDLHAPQLPFYYAQIATTIAPFGGGWDLIRHAQLQLVSEVPNTEVVAAADLALSDGIHVGTAGLVRLGHRLAKIAARHLFGHCHYECGPRPVRAVVDRNAKIIQLYLDGVNGKLSPTSHIPGFSVTDAQGNPVITPFDVSVDPDCARQLLIRYEEELKTAHPFLWYGRGANSYVCLTDSEDFAALLFGPLPIQDQS